MIKIDLITGFLGSGKTTFIKKYVTHLLEKGEKIGILENDYGAVNVDMMLLQDMISDNCDLEMVPPAFDYDCHRRRFKSKLIMMGMIGYDRVILEPSGIYDVDEFFEVLSEEPLDRWFEIGNVIAVIDANLEPDFSEQADYLLASQIAKAGSIILSKTQLSDEEHINATIAHLKKALDKVHVKKDITECIIAKDWGGLDEADYQRISSSSYTRDHHVKLTVDRDNSFQSLYFMNIKVTPDELEKKVAAMFEDPACGNIIRIKGFAKLLDETWIELNATRASTVIKPIDRGQEVFIVIGEDLDQKIIDKYWSY